MKNIALKFCILLLLPKKHHVTLLRLEKVVCNEIDPNFCKFDLCEVKPNQEKIPSFSMILRLLQVPLTNVIINTEFYFKKSNALLTNRTIDGCVFLKNRRRNPSFMFIYSLIEKFSNVNHTCPYRHDLHVYGVAPDKFAIPVPSGKYLVQSYYSVSEKRRFSFDFHLKVT